MTETTLLFASDSTAAEDEIVTQGGRVAHLLAERVLVAELPDGLRPDDLVSASVDEPADLPPMERLDAAAWRENEAKEFSIVDSPRAIGTPRVVTASSDQGLRAQTIALQQRLGLLGPTQVPLATIPMDTSYALRDRVAIALVVVAGPGELAFTPDEVRSVKQKMQAALDGLRRLYAPANISFRQRYFQMMVKVGDRASCPTTEVCEAPWRDPAMRELGYGPGLDGVAMFARALRKEPGVSWALVFFVTKYKLWGPKAYAGGPRCCVQFIGENITYLAAIAMHEIAHVFGAADEYVDWDRTPPSICSCGPSGIMVVPNHNCEADGCSAAPVKCLLREIPTTNDVPLCTWSASQLGWRQVWRRASRPIFDVGVSMFTPGVAELGGMIYLAFRYHDSLEMGCYVHYGDPEQGGWFQDLGPSGQANCSPSLVVFRGKLCAFYPSGPSGELCFAWTEPEVPWVGGAVISIPGSGIPHSASSPAATVFRDRLVLVYRGIGSDHALRTATFDGSSWSGNERIADQPGGIDPQSDHAPGVLVEGDLDSGTLSLIYSGHSGNTELFTAIFDGQVWRGNHSVDRQLGGIKPRTSATPQLVSYGGSQYAIFQGAGVQRLFVACRGPDGYWWGNRPLDLPPLSDLRLSDPEKPSALMINNILHVMYVSSAGHYFPWPGHLVCT
jgi:hypothetical protein